MEHSNIILSAFLTICSNASSLASGSRKSQNRHEMTFSHTCVFLNNMQPEGEKSSLWVQQRAADKSEHQYTRRTHNTHTHTHNSFFWKEQVLSSSCGGSNLVKETNLDWQMSIMASSFTEKNAFTEWKFRDHFEFKTEKWNVTVQRKLCLQPRNKVSPVLERRTFYHVYFSLHS